MDIQDKKELTFDEIRKLQRDHDKLNHQENLSLEEINRYISEVRKNDSAGRPVD